MMLRIVGFLLLFLSIAHADAVMPADIDVVDGDTIDALGKRVRLVGFDAPELGGGKPGAASFPRGPIAGYRGS
jgi:endonuclease YncB( thermonuclease family)